MRSEAEYLRRIQEDGIKLKNPGTIDIGTVDQGAAGAAPWPVSIAIVTRTPNFISVGASASGNIPATAKSWSFILLTGTGTIGGVAAPLGTPINGSALAAQLAYTTAGSSSAFVFYET